MIDLEALGHTLFGIGMGVGFVNLLDVGTDAGFFLMLFCLMFGTVLTR